MATQVKTLDPHPAKPAREDRLCIAILALGGQGGGVLSNWIADMARAEGWHAQATSVPGVAQRTGSTVYYVELARKTGESVPVMAQMPLPGDVDVVIASELMETGRAVLRGFSSTDRTTLIGSTHRIYAISEKMVRGDGTGNKDKILDASRKQSKAFIGFDMEEASARAGSIISSVMFGALAGAQVLPFGRQAFEGIIRAGGVAVESNLRGFEEGYSLAGKGEVVSEVEVPSVPEPTSDVGRALARDVEALPHSAQAFAQIGVARLMDYQDAAYAKLFLSRLSHIASLDSGDFAVTREVARYLALWMSYEDTIKVADLKVRRSRFERVRREVLAKDDQIVEVVEFMHPRWQEICETMPAGLGRFAYSSRLLTKLFAPLFKRGRFVRTNSLIGFCMLFVLSRLRWMRRSTLRYHEEQERIEAWLDRIANWLPDSADVALEITNCQRLMKGYSDTFERGLAEFARMMDHVDERRDEADLATSLKALREDALTQKC
ncbi:MAG: indolepyruvate oxidoreductase subunit beta family protein [Pseudomonadota bacterium]